MKSLLLAAIAVLGCAMPALAQDHSGHGAMATDNPATAAYAAANTAMHENMMMDYTGNPDVDFIKGMIPHHKGAVAMAKIVLEYGKDPEVRALAEGIIKAQEDEIAWMQEWLKKQGQ